MRPAPDCHLIPLEHEAVLFCEGRQELLALNSAATLLWLGLQDGLDEAAMTGELVELGLAPEEARRHVTASLSAWGEAGLLAETMHRRLPVARPGDELPDLPLPPAREPVARRRYRLLDTGLTVAFASTEQERLVHPVLGHLESPAPAPVEREILAAPVGDDVLLVEGGRVVHLCPGILALAPALKGWFLRLALGDHDYVLDVHAGVLARGDTVLLLPAASGRGKSSLTSALAGAGWTYLSDEIAPLGRPDLRLRPVPVAIGLKRGAWELLASRFPAIAELVVHDREDGKRVRYLPPPGPVAADRPEGWAARLVVFPDYRPGAATELRPLGRADLLRRLLAECLSLPGHLALADVEALVAWTGRLSAYELPNGDLDEAIAAIEGLLPPGR
jgi:hypothetical protein